jgi:hypothetical protein
MDRASASIVGNVAGTAPLHPVLRDADSAHTTGISATVTPPMGSLKPRYWGRTPAVDLGDLRPAQRSAACSPRLPGVAALSQGSCPGEWSGHAFWRTYGPLLAIVVQSAELDRRPHRATAQRHACYHAAPRAGRSGTMGDWKGFERLAERIVRDLHPDATSPWMTTYSAASPRRSGRSTCRSGGPIAITSNSRSCRHGTAAVQPT